MLHAPHTDNTQNKQQHSDANGLPAILDTPRDRGAKVLVKRTIKHFVVAAMRLMRFDLQQQGSQVGNKVDRHPPAQHQRNNRHGKNRKGVFTSRGLSHANGQKASRSDERTRQHGHGRHFIRKCGGADAVIALLHFSHHHFHSNDGVIHQQAQRNDE